MLNILKSSYFIVLVVFMLLSVLFCHFYAFTLLASLSQLLKLRINREDLS